MNIAQIKEKENLNYVLSTLYSAEKHDIDKKVAIIVSLYYEDLLEQNLKYLQYNIDFIDTYIISSNVNILQRCKEYSHIYGYKLIGKENRGRDITALLIAAKDIVKNYDYFCFIHDKKSVHASENQKEEIERWTDNIWTNMLSTKEYIYNILEVLNNNRDIGLLVPPEPLGDIFGCWYANSWMDNYDNTVELAKSLNLVDTDIDERIPPFTLSTCFWCKRAALDKLLIYPWKYNDFPDEPMKCDGQLNHAIERIIGYVAQDAGYKTGTVMTSEYSTFMLNFLQGRTREAMKLLAQNGIYNFYDVHQRIEKINNAFSEELCRPLRLIQLVSERIFIYGAGIWGTRLTHFCQDNNIDISGIVVSEKNNNVNYIRMKKVYNYDEISFGKLDIIIIAIKDRDIARQIKGNLSARSILLSDLIEYPDFISDMYDRMIAMQKVISDSGLLVEE